MNIQLLSHNIKPNTYDGVYCSTINAPMAFDNFDLNIIDLTASEIWKNDDYTLASINALNDFYSIKNIVTNSNKTIVLYVFPQNTSILWSYLTTSKRFEYSDELKNKLQFVVNTVLPTIIPIDNINTYEIQYERNVTSIQNTHYKSDFYFPNNFLYKQPNILTKSDCSAKTTTVRINNKIILTTCNIIESNESLHAFIDNVLIQDKLKDEPSWMNDVVFFNDNSLLSAKKEQLRIIDNANDKIATLNNELKLNQKYKSILYSNGSYLSATVFDMLEIMLEIDLKYFVDNFREDFLINKNGVTLIGEIKGVTSNVKSDYIYQAMRHYSDYVDENPDSDDALIHTILIINPLRKYPPNEREPINRRQIEYALRNNCLIVETIVFLRMFEKFLSKELSTDDCLKILTNNYGLLSIDNLHN